MSVRALLPLAPFSANLASASCSQAFPFVPAEAAAAPPASIQHGLCQPTNQTAQWLITGPEKQFPPKTDSGQACRGERSSARYMLA